MKTLRFDHTWDGTAPAKTGYWFAFLSLDDNKEICGIGFAESQDDLLAPAVVSNFKASGHTIPVIFFLAGERPPRWIMESRHLFEMLLNPDVWPVYRRNEFVRLTLISRAESENRVAAASVKVRSSFNM